MTVSAFLTVLWVIGVTAEAMTAALAAGRQRMDLFGVVLIACVTALGGGTVRDILLDNYPLKWVAEPHYLLVIVGAALATVFASVLMDYFRTLFLVLDAIGLSAFTVLGAQAALSTGHGVIIAVVAAVITGVFGGVLRDILCDRVPLVFSEELYASISLLGAVVYISVLELGMPEVLAVSASVILCVSLRIIAIFFRISLPVFEYQERVWRDPAAHRLNSRFGRWRERYQRPTRVVGTKLHGVASEEKAAEAKEPGDEKETPDYRAKPNSEDDDEPTHRPE